VPPSRRFGRSRFTLILLVLASLTVLTLDYRDTGPVQGLRSVVGTVFSPFEGVGNAIASPFRNGWKGIFSYDDLEDENAELQRELDRLRGEAISDAAYREENEELRSLQGLSVAGDIERVTAEVTSGPLTSFDSTFEINRGSGDGIERGMVVVTEAGLVGRVERVEGGRARIRVITDPEYPGFGVKLVGSGDVGTARPGPDGTVEVAEGIQADTAVERGEEVVTSGLDRSAYPSGIPVGTVASVGQTDDRTEQTVLIEPSADLEGLSFVVVLLCAEDCA
jgi:rod shape-determining protein MreC